MRTQSVPRSGRPMLASSRFLGLGLVASMALGLAGQAPAATPATAGPAMSLPLHQAVEMALMNNLDLQGARIDVQSAAAAVNGARGQFDAVLIAYYTHRKDVQPTVTFIDSFSNGIFDTYSVGVRQKLYYGATYEVDLVDTRTERGRTNGLSPAYSTQANIKYTQPLLKGFGRDANKYLIEQAKNSATISRQQLEATARDVARDTIRAYWGLAFTIRDLAVRKASLGLAEELLRKNRIMVDVGTLAPLEITQAEASVAQRRFEIISSEAAVGAAEDALRQLMGVEFGSPSWDVRLEPADEPEFSAADVDGGEALATSMTARTEIRTASLSIDNAKLGLAAAKDARQGQLDFTLGLTPAGVAGSLYQDPDVLVDSDGDGNPANDVELTNRTDTNDAWQQVLDREFTSWNASLNYTQPLPNRAARAEYTQRRLALEKSQLDMRKLKQAITLEVRKAVRDLDSARERIGAAGAARTLQEKTLQAEVKKFENGLSTNFEVLTFQTDLQTAESAELQALTDYLQALADVKRARGTLLQDYGLTVEEPGPTPAH